MRGIRLSWSFTRPFPAIAAQPSEFAEPLHLRLRLHPILLGPRSLCPAQAPTFPTNPTAIKYTPVTLSVGIIGGGPGGLLTASLLHRLAARPLQITIFEQSSRYGGKVLTRQFATAPVSYEAGAAEFYDYSVTGTDPLKDLIAELGLSITSMSGSAIFHNRQRLETLDDLRQHLGPAAASAYRRFHRNAAARLTPREFYESDNSEWRAEGRHQHAARQRFESWINAIPSKPISQLIPALIHSDLAAEPGQTGISYGLQNYLMNHPDYMRLYSIDGGNEQFVQRLASATPFIRRTEHRVTSVGNAPDGRLNVDYQHTKNSGTATFDFLVLALPIDSLKRLQFNSPRLTRAIQSHLHQFDHPAHYLRITMLFKTPFWRHWMRDAFCMLDQFNGCCLYDESLRRPGLACGILGWLIGGNQALEYSELSDEQLTSLALQSLPHGRQHAEKLLLESRVHRWPAAVSAWPGGVRPTWPDQRHRPEPVEHPRLFLTGDYLFDSTINGVMDSAESVANAIVAAVERSRT